MHGTARAKTAAIGAAVMLAAAGLAGCTIHFGPEQGCRFINPTMEFERGNVTVVKYHATCDVHPSTVTGAWVVEYLNRNNHKWEGAAKHFITLNTLPPANGKSYPYEFIGHCYPFTRERIHLYATSTWATGPDNINRYLPTRAGVLTKGCGQARGER